jgi:hypothetical protein
MSPSGLGAGVAIGIGSCTAIGHPSESPSRLTALSIRAFGTAGDSQLRRRAALV